MKKKGNERCPLQAECERKCQHEGHELDCDYYYNNALGDYVIEDQEREREKRWKEGEDKILDAVDAVEVETEEKSFGANQIIYIPADRLHPHPNNPRKDLGDLSELADSIKVKGVLQNLTVVPMELVDPDATITLGDNHYTILIGHRRHAAAKLAGLHELPCVITSMDEKEQLQTMLLENMQRSDLTVYEQAKCFQMVLDLGSTVEEISEKSGFSKTTVRRRLEIAKLDDKTMKTVSKRQLTLGDFDELAKIEDIDTRNIVLKQMGTANFQSSLRVALESQRTQKRFAEWLTIIGTFATEEPKAGWSSHEFIRSYSKWRLDQEVEVPEDADIRKYVYKVSDSSIDIYSEKDLEKEDAEKAEREEKDRIEKVERKERQDVVRRHFELRCAFAQKISNSACKTHFKEVAEFAARVMWELSEGGYNGIEIDLDILSHILGVAIDEDATKSGENLTDIPGIRTALEAFPEKTIFALAYSAADGPGEGYMDYGWENGKYKYFFKENESLDVLYGMLEVFDYELSDEEEQAKSGAHPLFPSGREEDPCELCKSAHPSCDKCCNICNDKCNEGQECRKESEVTA